VGSYRRGSFARVGARAAVRASPGVPRESRADGTDRACPNAPGLRSSRGLPSLPRGVEPASGCPMRPGSLTPLPITSMRWALPPTSGSLVPKDCRWGQGLPLRGEARVSASCSTRRFEIEELNLGDTAGDLLPWPQVPERSPVLHVQRGKPLTR